MLTLQDVGPGAGIQLHSTVGFECLSKGTWVGAAVASHTADTLTLGSVPLDATRLRYVAADGEWRSRTRPRCSGDEWRGASRQFTAIGRRE